MIGITVALLVAGVAAELPDLADASRWNHAAEARMNDGAYAEARRLYLRSVPALERALGPEHPATITALANLCVASSHMRAELDAVPLCARALALREKTLGPRHPDVARSLSDLGILYAYDGDLRRAEALLARARQIADALPEFADRPALLNNLGYLSYKKKQYRAAAGFFERAIASVERARGAQDPELATMRHNLAMAARAGRDADAGAGYRSALAPEGR